MRRDVHLGNGGPVYLHGFTIVQFGADGTATAAYYDSSASPEPAFTETL